MLPVSLKLVTTVSFDFLVSIGSVCSPPVVAAWNGTPDIRIESLSLEGSGEEADDEDNIAYKQLVVSDLRCMHVKYCDFLLCDIYTIKDS